MNSIFPFISDSSGLLFLGVGLALLLVSIGVYSSIQNSSRAAPNETIPYIKKYSPFFLFFSLGFFFSSLGLYMVLLFLEQEGVISIRVAQQMVASVVQAGAQEVQAEVPGAGDGVGLISVVLTVLAIVISVVTVVVISAARAAVEDLRHSKEEMREQIKYAELIKSETTNKITEHDINLKLNKLNMMCSAVYNSLLRQEEADKINTENGFSRDDLEADANVNSFKLGDGIISFRCFLKDFSDRPYMDLDTLKAYTSGVSKVGHQWPKHFVDEEKDLINSAIDYLDALYSSIQNGNALDGDKATPHKVCTLLAEFIDLKEKIDKDLIAIVNFEKPLGSSKGGSTKAKKAIEKIVNWFRTSP